MKAVIWLYFNNYKYQEAITLIVKLFMLDVTAELRLAHALSQLEIKQLREDCEDCAAPSLTIPGQQTWPWRTEYLISWSWAARSTFKSSNSGLAKIELLIDLILD